MPAKINGMRYSGGGGDDDFNSVQLPYPSVGIIIFGLLLLFLNFKFSCTKKAHKG